MNKHLMHLLLFDKLEIETKLSKAEILRKVKDFTDGSSDYRGRICEDGFTVAERNIKTYSGIIHTQNSFAPVAQAKIIENNGICTVYATFRMNALVLPVFIPCYLLMLITFIFVPFMFILLHFAFFKPMKRLKEHLTEMLSSY